MTTLPVFLVEPPSGVAAVETDDAFQALCEQAPVGLFLTDAKGVPFYVNPACCRLFGVGSDDLLGFAWVDRLHEDDRTRVLDEWLAAVSQLRDYQSDFRIRHPDGREIWVSASAVPCQGSFRGRAAYVGTVTDVTNIHAARQKLREQESLLAHVSRLSSMGELIAGIAHEVNQPLYAIGNCVRALRNGLRADALDRELLVQCAEEIARASDRAGGMLSRIRDFSRRTGPELCRADLNATIREATQLVAFDIGRWGVKLEFQLEEDLPPAIFQPIQIQQVIVNLITNACEAMRDSDCPERTISIRTQSAGDQLLASVSDTGPGVRERDIARIFDPFVTTKSTGMGLGLAISRTIIESHRGKLWFSPGPNRETIFTFSLPTIPPGRASDAPPDGTLAESIAG